MDQFWLKSFPTRARGASTVDVTTEGAPDGCDANDATRGMLDVCDFDAKEATRGTLAAAAVGGAPSAAPPPFLGLPSSSFSCEMLSDFSSVPPPPSKSTVETRSRSMATVATVAAMWSFRESANHAIGRWM